MAAYLLGRAIQAVPALLGVTLVVFLLLNASGDPTYYVLSREATEADRQAYHAAHGLDQPLYVQYVVFVWNALHADLGRSLAYNAPALDVLLARVPATLELAITSTLLALLLGIPAGVVAAFRQNS